MTAYWQRIIKSQYDLGNKTADDVKAFVPKRITQTECDEILATS
ncbi:MAG TPA: hypothetical protein VN429_12090 [Methanospirillum sp.]|nr:hypothetical protein [Methanospirillum sp.]HWQ65151.1 hypothetical protein [Methanospirillum sp.]